VSAQPDAPLRQIESQRKPHPPAEPGIGIGLRRPLALDQAAEHDAVALGEPRFEQAENAHLSASFRGLPHDFSHKQGIEQFHIFGFHELQLRRRAAGRKFVERVREFRSLWTEKGDRRIVLFR